MTSAVLPAPRAGTPADPFAELFHGLDEELEEAEVPPLTGGWWFAVVVIGVMAAALAVAGMAFAFHSVAGEMAQVPSIGRQWANLVPLIADLGIFVFSGVDIVLQRTAMPHPLARWMVYGLTFATIAMNLAADGADSRLPWLLRAGAIVAHVTGPLAWVVFVETVRHAVRVKALKATRSMREPIPFARWVTAPLPTLLLWRRMVMWGEVNYRKALRRDLYRLQAIGIARRELGWRWRWTISPDVRLRITLGLATAETARAAAVGQTPMLPPLVDATPVDQPDPEPEPDPDPEPQSDDSPEWDEFDRTTVDDNGQAPAEEVPPVEQTPEPRRRASSDKEPSKKARFNAAVLEQLRMDLAQGGTSALLDPDVETRNKAMYPIADKIPLHRGSARTYLSELQPQIDDATKAYRPGLTLLTRRDDQAAAG
jgi:hypothetical protein